MITPSGPWYSDTPPEFEWAFFWAGKEEGWIALDALAFFRKHGIRLGLTDQRVETGVLEQHAKAIKAALAQP